MSVLTPSGSAGTTSSTTITGATNPTIANVTMTLANTEYSYVLPTGTKQFMIKLRPPGLARMQLAYTSGQSNITYITIPANCNYSTEGLTLGSGITIYIQANSGLQIAEVVSWV